MFEIGTKIRLVASSCHKKTGLRRGSVGYVSNVHNPVAYPDYNMLVCSVIAVFYRYGFDKRTRVEKQQFINVFPIVDGKRGDIFPQAMESVDLVSGERVEPNWEKSLRQFYSATPKTPIAIAIPVGASECSLLNCDANEYRAMFSSYVTSQKLQRYVHSAIMTGHMSKAKSDTLAMFSNWHTIQNMSVDRKFRFLMLKDWLSTESRRKEAIALLQMIIAMMNRKELGVEITQAQYRLIDLFGDGGREVARFQVYDRLKNVLLNRAVMKQLQYGEGVFGGMFKPTKGMLACLEDIETTMGSFLVLSDRLESEYSQHRCK